MRFNFLLEGNLTNVWSFSRLCELLNINAYEPKGKRIWLDNRDPSPDPTFIHFHSIGEMKTWLQSHREPIELLCVDWNFEDVENEYIGDLMAWMEVVWQQHDCWPTHVVEISDDGYRSAGTILHYDYRFRTRVLSKVKTTQTPSRRVLGRDQRSFS